MNSAPDKSFRVRFAGHTAGWWLLGFLLTCSCVGAAPEILPRTPTRFSLENAVAVAPAVLADSARKLARPVVSSETVMEADGLWLRSEYRRRPLILLGNIVNNRALLPLYAASLAYADAYFPGGDGFVVRRLVVPGNVLILGGSTVHGVERAIAFYLTHPETGLHVELGGKAALQISRTVRKSVPLDTCLFAVRGENRFADAAVAGLEAQAGKKGGYFHASDYQLEPLLRAYRLLAAHAMLTPQQLRSLDDAWLRTLRADQDQYWRARNGRRIGSRHQTMGTSAFHAIVRMLLEEGQPNPEARALLKQWDRECRAYFQNALATFHDDIEGIPSYHSVQPMIHWAIAMNRNDYLVKQLPLALERALTVTDSLGAYAGTGTYEEARPGTVKNGIMLGYPLAVHAYLTHDPESNWLLHNFVHSVGTWGYYALWGTHAFAAGLTETREPRNRLGLQIVPLGPYRCRRRLGAEGDLSDRFEKLSWRSGWDRSSAFMVLQGWQGARADNQPPADANAILRYTNHGHIWLFSNCRKAGKYSRSAAFVSSGGSHDAGPPGCELLFKKTTPDGVIMTASRLRKYNGADWTRYVWWIRGRFVIVTDRLTFRDAGDYIALCTWRSPQPAHLVGRVWEATTGASEFRLVNLDHGVDLAAETGPLDGAALPRFLRERRNVKARPGDRVWFRNAFAVDEEFAAAAGPAGEVMLRDVGTAGLADDGARMTWTPWQPGQALPKFSWVLSSAAPDLPAVTQKTNEGPGSSGILTPGWVPIHGITVVADSAPVRGTVANLTDDLVSAYAGASWSQDSPPRLGITLPRKERVAEIAIDGPMLGPRNTLPEQLPAPFETEINGRSVRFLPELHLEPLHKGSVYPFLRFVARELGIEARTLDVRRAPARLRRIHVYRPRRAPVKVSHFLAAHLDGTEAPAQLVAAAGKELVVFDDVGSIRWRRHFAGEITAVRADTEVLLTTREARLYCLDAAGHSRWVTSFLGVPDLSGDCPTGYSIARVGNRIGVGNYARATFLDTNGKLVSTTFAYGAFETGWLPEFADLDGDGVHESLLFNIWSTLSVIDGQSRHTVKYVSCPRGRLKLLQALDGRDSHDPRVLIVTENGAAVLRAGARKTAWRLDLAPVAAAVRFAGGTAIAKSEGVLLLVDDAGSVVKTVFLPAPPGAMAVVGDRLVLALESHLAAFDRELRKVNDRPIRCAALTAVNERVYGISPDGTLQQWQP